MGARVIACVGLCLVLLWLYKADGKSCLGEHWQEAGLNQFVRNPFYWIAAFSFIFTYLAGTAVYSVVVSSIKAEVTRSVYQRLFVLFSDHALNS